MILLPGGSLPSRMRSRSWSAILLLATSALT
jgi:hypothetical protein